MLHLSLGAIFMVSLAALSLANAPALTTMIPKIVTFTATNHLPKRGETITLDWHAENTESVRIEIYDINYFPRQWSPGPFLSYDDLPASGTLDLTIPADYQGSGWQVHAVAMHPDAEVNDVMRLDLVFADVEQPIMLNVDEFTVSAEPVQRGDTVVIEWDTHVTTRGIDENGRVTYALPLDEYEGTLWVNVVGVVVMGSTGESPYNQRFASLHKQGSLEIVIGDYACEIDGVVVQLGMNIHGQAVMFDNQFMALTR